MRIWLIGCGTLLVIGIGVAVFFGNIVYKQFKESASKIDMAATSFQELEKLYPYEKQWNRPLTSEQVARFIASRRELLAVLNLHIEQWKNEESSVMQKFTLSMDIAPALAKTHVDALRKNHMSASEYFWVMNQVLVALRYGESEEAPPGLQALRQAFENPMDSGAANLDSGENLDTFLTETRGQSIISLLPQIEPWQIRITEDTLRSLLDNAEGLTETMAAFYYYDLHFKNTFSTVIEHEHDKLERTPDSALSSHPPEDNASTGAEEPEESDR
ncbi:MAG: hypothetical protein ABIK28_06965 [Planctomycetota bacterium]